MSPLRLVEAPEPTGTERLLQTVGRVAEQLMSAEPWEQDVEGGLDALGRAVGASRVYIFENQTAPDGEVLSSQRYEWVADGVLPQSDNDALQGLPLRAAGFGRWEAALRLGEAVQGHVREFPECERTLLDDQQIRSLVVVPIFAGSDWWGFMGFDACETEREWTAAEVEALRTAAGILGGGVRHARTADALQQSEERYRRMVEQSPDGIVVHSQAKVLYANAAALRLLGRADRADVTGLAIWDLVDPDDHDVVRTRLTRAETVGAREPPEIRLRRPDGERVAVEVTALEISFDGADAWQVVIRDITLRRRAEDAARELIREQAARAAAEAAEQRARFLAETGTILASSLDYRTTLRSVARLATRALADACIIYIVEDDGRIQRIEAAHADPQMERTLWEILTADPPDPTSPRGPLARVLRSGAPEVISEADGAALLFPHDDPDHLALCRRVMARSLMCVPLMVRGGVRGAISFGSVRPGRDFGPDDLVLAEEIAARAALAIDNARLYYEARQASQAKSEFMAVMSHELKTPLTAITTYAELLRDGVGGEPTEGQRRQLDVIAANSFHLARLIDEVLFYTRTESERVEVARERVEVVGMVRECIESVRPLADGKELSLGVDIAGDVPVIETDSTRLRQVVTNLLTNALRFTDRGGLHVGIEARDSRVWIRVSDTGIGISVEDQAMIWEPFWQADRSLTRRVGGTGLGLSIVRRLVHLLGGGITLRSAPGEGSAFTVWLPLLPP
jgi:PAS domain S-box-containing protein